MLRRRFLVRAYNSSPIHCFPPEITKKFWRLKSAEEWAWRFDWRWDYDIFEHTTSKEGNEVWINLEQWGEPAALDNNQPNVER